jgi:hypothetical protein
MRFSSAFVALCAVLLTASPSIVVNGEGHDGDHNHDEECTHGKLYVMDNATSTIYVMDVSKGVSSNMPVETTLELPAEAAGK